MLLATDPLVARLLLAADGLRGSFRHYGSGLVDRLPQLLAAALFLVLTVLAARLVRRTVEGGLRRTSTETYVTVLLGKLAFFGVAAVGTLVALSLGGVDLGVLVGSLGLATIALGFALQDVVSNFSAGVVLLLEHPFTRGDYVVTKGAEGVVEDIRVRATELRAPDGRRVVVPNKLLFTEVLVNASAAGGWRVEVPLRVPPGGDADRARAALLAAAAEVEGAAEPAATVLTAAVGADGVDLTLCLWVEPRAADPAEVRSQVLERVERALRAGGDRPRLPAPAAGKPDGVDRTEEAAMAIDEAGRARARNKARNKAQQLKGQIKQAAGRASGDRRLERQGRADEVKASLKQAGEKLKDAFRRKR